MFIKSDQVKEVVCGDGIRRKVLAYNPEMMMCEITFLKGAVGDVHSHPHTQTTYVLDGVFEFTIGEEKRVVYKGDSLLMPADVPHGTVALEDGVLLDIFSPMRADFL
ncbi:cupin domain-containing protein [Proteiniclasticum ruminis]|jgi:quercetin dioxygenase-like cupin family protein|uniref:Cupin domain-containing protein n=1 Tax=Proteiniclasticum ruminis TaxID=398199 RepID=A0A1G8GS41_9CLOT|nr:cupin domain-containing protein [Proteiniclasticum ruminis]SDH97110.1 Cupin domain-containing protein [Proteiniclasticum ruminis]